MTRRGVLRRVIANSGRLLGGKSAGAVLSLTYVAVATRALGVQDYGLLVLIHTFTLVVSRVFNSKSWQTVLRYGAGARQRGEYGRLRRLVRFTAVLDGVSAVLAALTVVLGARLIAPLLDWPDSLVPLASTYGVTALFMITATPKGLLRLFDRFDLLAVQVVLEPVGRLCGALVVLAMGGGLGAFLVVWFLSRAGAEVVLIFWSWREFHREVPAGASPGWAIRPGLEFHGIWRFLGVTNLNATFALSFEQLGTLLVGGLLGASEAGQFNIADRLARGVAKPARSLIPAIYPEMAQLLAEGDEGRLRRLIWRTVTLSGGVALLILGLLAVAGEPLLFLLGGEPAKAAYGLMLLLAASALLGMWWFPLEPLLISVGRPALALRAQVVATLAYVGVLYALVPVVGLWGSGVAAVLGMLVRVLLQGTGAMRWIRRSRQR
ncbi:lipopolysaccharide biosynthesis protein [Arhodomonas aquaeolei]|uniref:lipopolysaccharide biosynthesis protein n=1 Tax=Arhodomonas aquaeolei TaxID=2369 RepID=UPI001469C80A|nr:lipopolysaccharide biosynthesis protein [Arhodomonas aquaeolei]